MSGIVTHALTLPAYASRPPRALIQDALARAVDFLERKQLPYGEFQTFASGNKQLRQGKFDSSPFATAWIVDCLGYWKGDQAQTMIGRALDFLAAEMEGPGLWRYWSSRNDTHEFLPPDVDDTCCVSFVLKRYGRAFPANRKIILANRNREGLFYTWIVARPDSSKQIIKTLQPLINPGAHALWSIAGILDNVDCAVNANVLLYLGESAATQAAIARVIEIVRGTRTQSGVSFYPDALGLYYMISRAYANGVLALAETRDTIVEQSLACQKQNDSFGNELLTAMAICTLLNFEQPSRHLERAVRYLSRRQTDEGAWSRCAAFLGPAPYYGSEELTTALGIQALARYYQTL